MTITSITDRSSSLLRIYRTKGASKALEAFAKSISPHPYDTWIDILSDEIYNGKHISLPIKTRVKLLRQGFPSYLYNFYEFNNGNNPSHYLDEYARRGFTGRINDDPDLLADKERFYRQLSTSGYGDYAPKAYGKIVEGEYESDTASAILSLLYSKERLVVKMKRGSGGNYVYICTKTNGGVTINGSDLTESEFMQFIAGLDGYLVQEYVDQAGYLDNINPNSANTIRILTIHPEGGSPFIAVAVQRMGTSKSRGFDNFSQGGLSAEINIKTGELSKAVRPENSMKPYWYDTHPNTGTQIEGYEIPEWDAICDQLLQIARSLPEVKYAGWDVLITEPGEFILIEANSQSDVDLLQVHKPLLADDNVREFYANNGVPI